MSMREFCKFSPEFWGGHMHEKIKKLGKDALLLAVYLKTNRHTNMLGVYYLPLAYASHDTGIAIEEIQQLLEELSGINFCHYDPLHGIVWVVDLGFIQTGGPLKGHDKRVIQLQKQYEALPRLIFLQALYEKYQTAYHLRGSPAEIFPETSPLEGPSESHRSKKKYKYKKKEKNKEKEKKNTFVAELRPRERDDPVERVFSHWKQIMNHPRAALDGKRKKLIGHALQLGYDEAQLCEAITGCSLTPHNVGDNDRGQRFDGLHVILRDADQIDRFIRNCTSPPQKLTQQEQQARQSYQALQPWFEGKEAQDGIE